ncbi:TolC family protein [Sulfurimonas sp.]|uniref:TolC family protein n=1 Tax=Sulfurimonas sp. TaxID=2022749 RepID=UPI0025F15431|nr:TolC family protein [Sulfurimonas sp.]
MLKILTTILLGLSLHAQDVYTVDELILQALKNSPDLKISSSQYKASKSRYEQAFAGYLPKVDLQLSAGEFGLNDLTTTDKSMTNDTLLLGKISLQQLLYDFGKTKGSVDALKYGSDSYLSSNEQQISNKKMSVKQAYYEVLQAIALIEVYKENVKLNEKQLYRSQKYFEAGIRTKIDISDAKVELIKSKLDLRKGLYNLKLSYASLDKVVGFMEVDKKYEVYSQSLVLTNIYSSLSEYELTLKDSINFAYENRYELKKYLSDIQSAQSSSVSASSNYYPKLSFYADYTKQQTDKFEDSLPEEQWQAALNLNWNIYEGGATSASTQEKKINIKISHSQLNNSKLSIKKETTQAFINVYKMKDSVELAQSLLEVSGDKFDQAQKRYEYGLSDYIELQQSRQGYIDAKSDLVVNYYDYYNAIAVLDKAIGK